MDSPKIAQFVEDLWIDWQSDLNKLLDDDVDVLAAFKSELQQRAVRYENTHPPTNAGQSKFWDTVQEFIQEADIDSASNPFATALQDASYEQTRRRETKQREVEIETERIQKELASIEEKAIERAKERGLQVKATERKISISEPPSVASREDLERMEIDSYVGGEKDRLDRIEQTKELIVNRLDEKFPQYDEEIKSIVDDIENSTDARELTLELPQRLVGLPGKVRENLIRMIKFKNEELTGVRQTARPSFRRRN